MKREYKVEGMSCDHCRKGVESALNSIAGVHATVTLDPPVAIVECTETMLSVEQLQEAIFGAGDYIISETDR